MAACRTESRGPILNFLTNQRTPKQAPNAITLGGGHSDPVQPTVEAHANTFRAAARIYSTYTSELKKILNA